MKHLYPILLGLSLFGAQFARADQQDLQRRRQEIRAWVIANSVGGAGENDALPTIAPGPNDRAAALVDRLETSNLAEMDTRGLRLAKLPKSPWSDYYWPTYSGQLAHRYADPEFHSTPVWRNNADFLTKALGRGELSHYSPAEKYDLLLGDTNFTLSRLMIRAGEPYADANGEVETWFGLCHGWAPASFMLPRPARAVTVKAADGREVEFTPSDLKALATLLWSNGGGQTRFVGGRCNDKEPEREDGVREKNPDCFDTNPATWHVAAVNQIGVSKRAFVMDASAGYEVWNQPVNGYEYAYINPITGRSTRRLAEARVRLADYANDPFRKKRSREAVNIVKIVMTVDYVGETEPSTAKSDGEDRDSHTVVNYSYDLELDAADNIVGGEWHTSVHPDFLWVPVPGARATSLGDALLEREGDRTEWKDGEPLPASWARAGRYSAQREQPLARVVERLIELAK